MNTRDHGGDLAQAITKHGGRTEEWIDLSTGINRMPWPAAPLSTDALGPLPGAYLKDALIAAAKQAFSTNWLLLPLPGAQAAIQSLPLLARPGLARVLTPTYNEFAPALRLAQWHVEEVTTPKELIGADMAIIVNPNNPDGRITHPDLLRELALEVGTLVVDESFADPHPELSLLTGPESDNILVLRSFGKFYGLAGLRLGFLCGPERALAHASQVAGPWPVSGPALEIATAAYLDPDWRAKTITRLAQDAARLDRLAEIAGWRLAGGTPLFRLYETPDAEIAQNHLANFHIWSRVFPYSSSWVRLGLPAEHEWHRVERALSRA